MCPSDNFSAREVRTQLTSERARLHENADGEVALPRGNLIPVEWSVPYEAARGTQGTYFTTKSIRNDGTNSSFLKRLTPQSGIAVNNCVLVLGSRGTHIRLLKNSRLFGFGVQRYSYSLKKLGGQEQTYRKLKYSLIRFPARIDVIFAK